METDLSCTATALERLRWSLALSFPFDLDTLLTDGDLCLYLDRCECDLCLDLCEGDLCEGERDLCEGERDLYEGECDLCEGEGDLCEGELDLCEGERDLREDECDLCERDWCCEPREGDVWKDGLSSCDRCCCNV